MTRLEGDRRAVVGGDRDDRARRPKATLARHTALFISALVTTGGCREKNADQAVLTQKTALSASASSAPPAASTSFYATRFSKRPSVPAMTEAGRSLFFDPALSRSKKLACATCHDPRFAYGPPNDHATQLGGPEMNQDGLRAVPSLRYLEKVPAFTEHLYEEAKGESVDQGPTGGHGWDGRANSTHDQARLPLTSPFEMANDSVASVVDTVSHAAYAPEFRAAFGDDVFADPKRAENAVLLALEVFQQSPKDFYPYHSRFDEWLRQKATLTAEEERGLSLFSDPKKGNCASCHPSLILRGAFPGFTDFGFVAVGVPRNPAISANKDPTFFDLGLCGPLRTDLSAEKKYCGAFRAPTLRNVTLRRVFFHNGVFHRLEEVLEFYAERDTNPKKWFPKNPDGTVDLYNDMPPEYRANVEQTPPFGRKPGERPALTRAEIRDMLAFLGTLTDADLVANAAKP
jgi:cytochrome c peroxidase